MTRIGEDKNLFFSWLKASWQFWLKSKLASFRNKGFFREWRNKTSEIWKESEARMDFFGVCRQRVLFDCSDVWVIWSNSRKCDSIYQIFDFVCQSPLYVTSGHQLQAVNHPCTANCWVERSLLVSVHQPSFELLFSFLSSRRTVKWYIRCEMNFHLLIIRIQGYVSFWWQFG